MRSWLRPILLVLASVAAPAYALPQCDLAGRFESIVFKQLGQSRALASTSYALQIVDAASGQIICDEYVNPLMNVYPASTIKTLIAMAVLRHVDAGTYRLTDEITITQTNADRECQPNQCAIYGIGKKRTIHELITDSITVSNNIATNQLIDLADRTWINETADRMGAPTLRVFRKMYAVVDPEPGLTVRNLATALGLAQLYAEIAVGRQRVLSESSRQYLVGVLAQQRINGSLNKYFPQGVVFFHKTGSTSRVTGDGGYYMLDSNRIAILTALQNFNSYSPCTHCSVRSGREDMAAIGKAVYSLLLTK